MTNEWYLVDLFIDNGGLSRYSQTAAVISPESVFLGLPSLPDGEKYKVSEVTDLPRYEGAIRAYQREAEDIADPELKRAQQEMIAGLKLRLERLKKESKP